MIPLVISFHTTDAGYTAEAAGLVESLDRLGIAFDILPLAHLGPWVRACAYKARFVQMMRKKHQGRSLLWLDADARLMQWPTLMDSLCGIDFAAHWLGETELLSSTAYFGVSPATDSLIDQWVELCREQPDVWDQKHLQSVVESMPDLRVMRLPPSYAWIQAPDCQQDISWRHYGDIEPVIIQRQASRRLK